MTPSAPSKMIANTRHKTLLSLGLCVLFSQPALAQQEEDTPATEPDFSVYTSREPETFTYIRLVDTSALTFDKAEHHRQNMAQLNAYFLTLAKQDETRAPGYPDKPRLLGVTLGYERASVVNYPILPSYSENSDILPGEEYRPQWYNAAYYGDITAIRASATLTPYTQNLAIHPTIAFDTRVPLQNNQGPAEILLRVMGDTGISLGDIEGRVSFWGAFQNKSVGLFEPAPGGKAGASLLLVEGSHTLTLLRAEGAIWGMGEFFDRTATVNLSQSASFLGGRIVGSAGVGAFSGALDEALYMTWTESETTPYSNALDLTASARLGFYPIHWFSVYGGWEQVLAHRESSFIDGFYRPTGPQYQFALNGTIMRLMQVGASLSVNEWEGAMPSSAVEDWDGVGVPEGTWWQSTFAIQLTGIF